MSNQVIHPHPGQTVLYYALKGEVYEGNKLGDAGIPAIVTEVMSDDCINLELITGPCRGLARNSVCHIESDFPGVSGWGNVDGDLRMALNQIE